MTLSEMEGHEKYWVPRFARLTEEHGWICVRDEKGWLMWSMKVNDMPAKGVSLAGIITSLTPMPLNPSP
jgi:hypothetical protein